MKKARVLFVSQEMVPYLESSQIGDITRKLPQGIQEAGKEIRTFIPRYGCINERRNQLHEVIRLSGLNVIIDDADHPLIIKVASIQAAKMQVYFIDNEDYFQRKSVLTNKENGEYCEDNDERAIFFCRGVLETVKKLGWAPDVVHCHGWFSSLVPLYLKKAFNEDPIYMDTKIVYSVYNKGFEGELDARFAEKSIIDGVELEDVTIANKPSFKALNKLGIEYADAIIQGSEEIDEDLLKFIDESKKPFLTYCDDESFVAEYDKFYDQILDESTILAE
jgi:starch synthase